MMQTMRIRTLLRERDENLIGPVAVAPAHPEPVLVAATMSDSGGDREATAEADHHAATADRSEPQLLVAATRTAAMAAHDVQWANLPLLPSLPLDARMSDDDVAAWGDLLYLRGLASHILATVDRNFREIADKVTVLGSASLLALCELHGLDPRLLYSDAVTSPPPIALGDGGCEENAESPMQGDPARQRNN